MVTHAQDRMKQDNGVESNRWGECAVLARMIGKGLSEEVTSEQVLERRRACYGCPRYKHELCDKPPNLVAYNNHLLFLMSLSLAWVVSLPVSPACSWRHSWAVRSKNASLSLLAVGIGFWMGHLSSLLHRL